MPLAFRNIDADPSDPVSTWPYEGLVTAMERGSIRDWRRLAAELRGRPWGRTARHLEAYLSYAEPSGATALLGRSLERAREDRQQRERSEVARRVDGLIIRSGHSAADFAAEIGTSPSRLSTYRTGAVVPSATLLVRMEWAAEVLAATQPR